MHSGGVDWLHVRSAGGQRRNFGDRSSCLQEPNCIIADRVNGVVMGQTVILTPYWEGLHPVDDPEEELMKSIVSLPFHPLN